jgi:AcrR family transcriptional regulator
VKRPKTRREKQAETRASLLRSAARLFCRKGLEGASVDEVAADAGYTKGAFYANFKSKEELFLVMLDEKFAAQMERLDAALAGAEEPGEEARHATQDFIRSAGSDREWRKLYFEFVAYAARNEEFRQELATRHRALRERVSEILRRWSADFPAPPPIPIEDIAAMSDFMVDGFLLDQLIDPELDEELLATLMLIFFRGIQALAVGWEPPEALPSVVGGTAEDGADGR